MDDIQEMVAQLEKEGYRVDLSSTMPVICWLWRDDRMSVWE